MNLLPNLVPLRTLNYRPLYFSLALGLLLPLVPAKAHSNLENRIAEVDQELAQNPNDADLLLTRGLLYFLTGDWATALLDFDAAETYATQPLPRLDYLRAEALALSAETSDSDVVAEDRWKDALEAIDRYFANRPENQRDADAHFLRAKILAGLGRFGEAAEAQDTIVTQLNLSPGPSFYKTQAKYLREDGRLGAAVAFMDKGILKARGRGKGLLTLQEAAIKPSARLS